MIDIQVASEAICIADPEATQGGKRPLVYPLETAPVEVFNAWLDQILKAEPITDTLFLFTIKAHREDWEPVARWWLVAVLALHGVDMQKYYALKENNE